MEDNKNKTKVDLMYDDLYEQGYLENDRDTFNKFFFAPGEQGYKNRKALYDDLHEQGYLESPTYEDFAKGIGLHSVQQGAARAGQAVTEPQQVGQQAVQGNGRRDMVESLDKYYEGLQVQNAPQAPVATPNPASSPSFGGGGAASSWKDGQSIKTSGGRRQQKARQKDLYVDDKGNPALGTSEEDFRDIDRSGLYYPLMRNDSINLAGTEAFKKGWLVQPQLDKNVRFAEARKAGYKAQGEKFKDLSDEQLVQAMREEEKKLDGSTSPESLQASMNVRYIETLMAAREWGLGDVPNFNATPYMVDYYQVKRQYNKNGLVDKYEKNMLTGRDDNPLLIRGWELIEDQYLKDEADGNLRDASYYRNLPFYDPKFAEEFGAYITARIKVTGERWNDAVKDAIDDFEAAAAEGRVGQRHSEEYLGSANRGQVDDMLDKVNAALKKRTGELDDKFNNKSWFQRLGESSYDPESPSSRYLTDPDASNLIWAGRALQDAKKIIAAFDANRLEDGLTGFFKGAGRGLVDSLGDLSTWDGGISDMLSAQRLNAAVDKFRKGKPLSASEKALLEATSLKLATAEIFKEVGRGYKAGTVTGESLPFMVEMALNPIAKSGNKIASGLAKYANKYLGKYLKKMVSKLGRSSAGRMATRMLGSGLAKNAGRVTARVVGDIGAAGGMAATSGLGHSAANAIGYHTGDVQYQQGAGGKTHFSGVTDGDDWVTSTLKGFGSTTIENASEMWGEYFKPITNFLGSVSGKALEKMHLGAITRWLNDVNSTEMARLMSDFRKQTRWDGNIAEYFEEVAGNIANALTVGDKNLSLHDKDGNISLHERNSVFNIDDNIDTFLGVSLMSGAMGSANIAGYRTPKYRAKQDVKRYGDMARGIFGARGNDWSTIETLIRDNSEEGRKQFVADLMQSGKYSKREKQAALQYAGAVYKSMGMDLGESKRSRSAGEQEAEEAYGRGYDMANLETIAETSNAYNQLRSQMEQEYGTELMERMDSEPGLVYGWVRAGAVSEEDAKKVLDYLNAKMAYEGAVDRLNDDDSAAKAAAEAHVDDTIHTEENGGDGQIHPVTLKGREGDHYVVSGNVVTDNDSNVDVDASDNDIVVVDSNGKRKMTTAKDIAQVGDTIDPDAAKAQAVASIESVSAQASGGLDTGANQVEGDETLDDTDLDSDEVAAPDGATQQDASSIQAPLPVTEYNQDDLVTVEVDGQQVDGIVTNGLDSNGNVTLYLEEPINGRQNVQLTPEQLNQVAVSYTSRDGETISRGETPQEPQQPQPQQQQAPTQEPAPVESGEVTQTPTAPAQEQAPASGESEEPLQQPAANGELDVQTGETPQTPNAPVAEAPQQAPAQPSLPVGEDGNADFSNATPQEAHDYIYNDPELDEDEADEVVRSYAAGAQSRLDEAQAALKQAEAVPAPKMEDYRSGNAPDVAGYKRAKRERNEIIAQAQAAVDAAQREVDLWNGVQAQHMMARAAANVAANREENPAAPSAPAPVSGESESENNAPAPSQTTPAQGQQTTESTQEPSAPQPNEGNGPMASTSPATGVGTQPQEEDNEGDGEDQDPGDSGESASPEASGVETRELTPDERIEQEMMETLERRANEMADSCGLPVQVARSLDDLSDSHRRQVEKQHAEGKYVNGFYDPMTKQIVLFLPDIAKNGGLRRLERTFLHEGVAHGGLRALFENAQNGIQTFDELCDQVWEMMPVVAQAQMMNYIGVQKPEDMTQEKKRIAADEYMAHLAEWGVDPSVKTRIITAIKNALRKIGVKMKLSNNDIVSLLAASRRHLNEMDKARDSLEDHGIATSDSGDALMFAVSDILEGDERKKAIKELMDVTGRSEATVKKWLKAEESLAKVILDNDNVELLDLQVDESVPSIWNNSDYPQGTVEFSNICRKRLPFTVIYQRLQEEFPNTVFDASTLEDIRNTMKENGVDVACGLCFVEDRRQLLGEIGEGFIKMVEGEEADLNENQQKALDKLRESGDNYVPNLYELLTLDGMKKLRKEHPAVAKAFVEFNNARGMQAGRLFQAYSAYHREILNWNKAKVKKVNDAGGLRIFSFSDFEAHHLIDLVQVLTDCAAKGVKVQGYTKVPEFAKAVKETKMKLNRSLIAKGKGYVDADYVPKEGEAVSPNVIDGKRLLLDTVEGINVNHPDFFDSTDNNNVGNILVGINDEQIRLAMADSFVDYIIPFHSGLSEAIRAKKGIGDWVNYKLSQLEKKRNDKGKLVNADKHGVNIYTDVLPRGEELIGKPIRNARDFQNAFFKACEEKGWVPRFSKFINKNKKGQYVYTPGYEKLLLDFKLFDKNGKLLPQEAVVPLFDNEFNKKILDDYVKGEKAKTPYDDLYEKIKERLGLPNGTVIKSQEDEDSGVLFSSTPAEISEEEREVLMGIHNITAEKLRSAIGLGGLANPSMAVVDTTKGLLNNFGEISLIPGRDLIDKRKGRNAGTFTADAYTPRFPTVHRRLGKGGEKKLSQWIKSLGMRLEMEYNTQEQFNDWVNGFDIQANALVYPFLHEKGLSTAVDQEDHNKVSAPFREIVGRHHGDINALMDAFDTNEEVRQEITDIIIDDIVKQEAQREEGESWKEYRDRRRKWRQLVNEAYLDFAGFVDRGIARATLEKECSRYVEASRFNPEATRQAASIYIDKNGMRSEYTQWREQRFAELGVEEQMYAGSDSQGRSKYKPITLEGVSRAMKKQGLAGGESKFFSLGPGGIRARLTPRLNTLKQIRGERGRIQSDIDSILKDYSEELDSTISNLFGGDREAAADVLTSADMKAKAKELGYEIGDGTVRYIEDFKQRVMELPTEYFETKFERPVMLNEFEAAVVPNDVDSDIREALEAEGLDVREYDPELAGDRERVTIKTAQDSGNVLFSTSPTFYSNAERAVENIKQNKATAEQWKAMLTKAGGIKAGEDKWMGLSAWFDENKGKSLTKDEVLQFVRDNGIQMEEVEYGEGLDGTAIYNRYGLGDYNFDGEPLPWTEWFDLYYGGIEFQGDLDDKFQLAEIVNNQDHFVNPEDYHLDQDSGKRNFVRDVEAELFKFVQKENEGKYQIIEGTRLDYTTKGLENKREIAFVVPGVEPYQEGDTIHFGPENKGKAVMWVRFGETTDADGNRVLVIDEIQSNRHQDAREVTERDENGKPIRRRGYITEEQTKWYNEYLKSKKEASTALDDFFERMRKKYHVEENADVLPLLSDEEEAERMKYWRAANGFDWDESELNKIRDGIHPAPFETNWHEVAMKRMLRLAAEEGFDKVAWTTGEQQAKRYDLSKQVDEIVYKKNEDGTYRVSAITGGRGNLLGESIATNELPEIVGRDLSQKIVSNEGKKTPVSGRASGWKTEEWTSLAGEDLKIGGEGMKGFYDQMLPRFMDKYGKRWGVKTGTVELPNVEEAGRTMHSVDVTPEMKESVMQGQPLFSVSNYSLGVPYQGTKGRIARSLMEKLPSGRRFVDLFAGGGAMTHAAMLSGKYDEYHMNDVNPVGVELFMQGLRGEWDDYNRTSMTPEEFKQIKGTPEAIPWSVLGLGRNLVKGGKPDYINRVKRLGQLRDQADKVSNSFEDYRNVEIRPGDVVYADIPYENTDTYNYGKGRKFDKKAFCDWAQAQDFPIFVSESVMPEGWVEIASEQMKTINPKKNRTEKLWVQEKFADEFKNEGVRFSTGWHGSGSEFDRFDHSHMGEGEGAQAYGWGTYITSVEGIGRSYATESAKKNPTYYWKGQKIDRASINPLSMAYDVVEREGTIKKAIALVDRFLDNPDAHENWAEVKEILKQSKKSDFTKKPARYLYEVEIPDNNGENYISWNETLPKKHRRRIAAVVRDLSDDLLQRGTHGPNWLRGGFEQLANTIEREQYAGKEITERLRDALGNSRAVSEIFSKAGFVGTEYPAQYLSGGRKDGAKNYVIYNEDDIEIKDRIRFSTSAAVDALRDDERVYNDLLGKVFSGVSNETRRGIVEDAMRNRGNDFGAATEAWLGGLADDGKFADVDRRDWGRVKLALHQALMDNGVDVSEPLTDGESRYVLWKAGQIDDGVFSMAEDVVMRDRLLNGANAPQYTDNGVRFSVSGVEPNYVVDGEVNLNSRNYEHELSKMRAHPLLRYLWNRETKIDLPYRDVFKTPTTADYFVQTETTFEPVPLNGKTRQEVWDELREKYGETYHRSDSGSEYLIDEETGDIYRRSDHWGKVASCRWYLDLDKIGVKNVQTSRFGQVIHFDAIGKSNIKDFKGIHGSAFTLNPEVEKRYIPLAEQTIANYRGILGDNRIKKSPAVRKMLEDTIERTEKLIEDARNGNYGISKRDGVMFSISPRDRAMARDQYERYMRSGRLQWVESMQDSMLGLKKLMQAIMGNNWTKIEDVAMYENPYIAENLMSSVTAAQQQAFYTEFMKPLLEEVSKLCKGGKKAREKAREDLTNYLMAKHGLERNQVLADRDAQETAQAGGNYQDAYAENRERDYSGLTALTGEDDVHAAEAKAQQMVDDYEAQHDTTELWSRINAATQVTLEKQYKSGMLSYAEYQRISGMFDYYVPLRGWEETTSDEVYGYLTSKAGPFLGGGIVKRAEGRTSKADDPIATIAQMGDDSIRTGNRNLMKQTFLNFVQNHPSDAVSVSDLWLQYDAVTDEWIPVFADIDPNDSADVVEQKIQDFEQHMQELAEQEPDKYKHGREAANIPYRVIPGMEKEHQVLVKRNGQTWVLTINGNPRAAQALNGLTNPDVPMEGAWASAIRGAEWVNRTLSALYTTLSPAFIVSNFLRDSGYSNTMVWVRESPNYALRFNANYLKLNPATLRFLLGRWENGTLDESKPLQKHFKEFMLNGGETGFAMVKDIDKYKKDLLNEVKNMNSKNFVRKGMKIVGSQYELLGRSIENCARFAAYVTSREMGRDVKRSAYDAKEISVNFNKKGSGGKSLGKVGQTKVGNVGAFVSGMARSLYTFWNAGVQGMTNAGRAVKRHPVKAALMGAGPLYVAGFLAPILAQMMGAGGDGDDDKNAYYNLPEYVRRSNLCIWLGDAWLTIPLPIEFRSIYGLGELTYGVISGNERYTDEELAMQVAGQFSQLLPIDMLEGGGGFHPFIPTLFKPIVEAEQNKSWSGLPIYRSSEWNKDDPEYTKAFSNANEWIVSGAEWLNAMTGGDEFKKGWIDLNPAKIEYMLKGYLGGIYTTIDEVRRAAETAFGKRDFEWRNIPLANRVIKQGDERTESKKLRDEYFKYKEDYEETKRLINKYKNAEDTDLFDYAKKLDLLNNSKEYGRYLIFEKYSTMLEAYQKAKKGASGETLKKIEEDEKVLMRQLVNEMHAFEDGKITVGNRPKLSKKDRSEDYGYMYNNLRTYVDINEDALLDSSLKRAKASGDKGMAAALSSIKRSIGEMKKGLGRGNDDKVMDSIRRMREGVLRSFGLLDGGEVEPDVPEAEEPQEEWGDEGQDNVSEPEDDEFESFE